jgi:hypothetical protein
MISRDQVNRTLEIDDEIELDQVGNLVEAALEADGGYEQDAVQNMTPEQFKAWETKDTPGPSYNKNSYTPTSILPINARTLQHN